MRGGIDRDRQISARGGGYHGDDELLKGRVEMSVHRQRARCGVVLCLESGVSSGDCQGTLRVSEG